MAKPAVVRVSKDHAEFWCTITDSWEKATPSQLQALMIRVQANFSSRELFELSDVLNAMSGIKKF